MTHREAPTAPEAPVHYRGEAAPSWEGGWEAGWTAREAETVELTDEELVRAYRGLKPGVDVHVNPGHVAGLRRALEAARG